jgi:hypothetical protein
MAVKPTTEGGAVQGPLGHERSPRRERNPAMYDVDDLADRVVPLLDVATGATWYEEGNPVDDAVVTLCRLRRAAAGGRGSTEAGDAAVRDALGRAAPGAVVWALSRAISYMDEQGYPEEWEASRAP